MLIGIDLKGEALTAALDACLCTEAELAALAAGKQFDDPFAEWPMVEQFLDSGDEDEEEAGEGEEEGPEEVELDDGNKAGSKEQQGEERSAPATSEPAAKRARRAAKNAKEA